MPNAAALAGPQVIQGGMGVAVSGWPLARAVASSGQLGVVSGTALEAVCARRLQQGDPGGHVRRALASFPAPAAAERVLATYYVEGGIPAGSMFRGVPMWTLRPSRHLQELAVVANFVEVFLAKEGHGGPVGINFLRKIELPTPFACYGAMLAGVNYVRVTTSEIRDVSPAGAPRRGRPPSAIQFVGPAAGDTVLYTLARSTRAGPSLGAASGSPTGPTPRVPLTYPHLHPMHTSCIGTELVCIY